MGKQPKHSEDEMLPLNVDLPPTLMARVKLAKALTNTPIRKMVADALDAWLREHKVTEETLRKLSK